MRLDKEIRGIEEAIRRAANRDLFKIIIKTAVRSQDIRRAIAEEQSQIVHFCGHGQEDGSILLEDDWGNNKPVVPEVLASLFELHTDYVECVVLNACFSEKSAIAISKHINYAIGMNQPIDDKAAIVFAQGFYEGLTYNNLTNKDVFQRAFNEGVVAIKLENISQGGIPVIKQKFNTNVASDEYSNKNLAVYKQEEWVGRREETDALLKAIKGSCRITVILGITGIGKTALAERIIYKLRLNQEKLLRQDFYDSMSSTKSFIEVAKGWLRKLEENIPVQENDLENILSLLADKLCYNSYVILIDSLEYILTGNEDMGWGDFLDEGWNKFFLKILSADSCQSRFILTSQDLPLQFRQLEDRYRNFFSRETLKGLEETKQIELFQKQGLDCAEEEKYLLSGIGKAYMGHPLALLVIAGEIKNDFHCSVIGYWERFGFEIEEVEKSLEEATKGNTIGQDNWNLDSYSEKLKDRVESRLKITFERLKNNAYVAFELICNVSVYRRPERESAWLIQLEDDYDAEEIRQALVILKSRALVEISYDPIRKTNLLGLHNLIRSQALYYLRQ